MQARMLSLKEAAARLRLTERAVARLAQKGELRGTKEGMTWVLDRESVEEWLRRQSSTANSVTTQTLSPEATGIPESPTILRAMSPLRMNFNLMAQDREGVLRELTALVVPPADKRMFNALLKALKAREDMCTTCVNEGIAIPHSRNAIVGLVDEPVIAYGRHRTGIEYGAFDGKPVRHFFLLCAPNVRHHLQLLARLSRILHNNEFRRRLEETRNAEELLGLIKEFEPTPS